MTPNDGSADEKMWRKLNAPCKHANEETLMLSLDEIIEWCPDCGAKRCGSRRARWVRPRCNRRWNGKGKKR